jgi:glycosyltransferase involved in cell wall biosynthesis
MDVRYNQFFTGNYIKRKIKRRSLHKPLRMCLYLYDIVKFVILLLVYRRPNVLLNPSFGETAMKRDVCFLSIAKFFHCKVVVFIHGWDKNYLQSVKEGNKKFSPKWKQADAFIVLAAEFKQYLLELDVRAPIYLTSTKVDDNLISGISPDMIASKKNIRNILFLARVTRAKGIFTALDAMEILNKKYANIEMHVVGLGDSLEDAKRYCNDKGLNNVTFYGALYGDDLKKEFLWGGIYILPTHGEGMPTSVLEAMAMGLVVITRPVGGLVDFFEQEKMGYMIESLDPKDYANAIEKIISDMDYAKRTSLYNHLYAKEHFMASKVAVQLENIVRSV